MRKREKIISIVLFALAGLLIIYTIWAFINCQNYITDAVESGQLVISGNVYDVVNFYMSNCSQYALFAVLLFGMGWLLRRPPAASVQMPSKESANLDVPRKDEDDLDEWFKEMQQDK